jgi:hypothetical protein
VDPILAGLDRASIGPIAESSAGRAAPELAHFSNIPAVPAADVRTVIGAATFSAVCAQRCEPLQGVPVIWGKTDAGRAEMKARSLIKERARRNLLLLVDGKPPVEKLLANLPGLTGADLAALQALGLIEPVSAPPPSAVASSRVDIDSTTSTTRPCAVPSAG